MSLTKTVSFTLDCEPADPQVYTLTYDFNELVNAEKKLGLNLLQGLVGGTSTELIRGLLFAFLLKAHPLVTVAEAGDLFSKDTRTVMQNFSIIMENFDVGTDEEEEGKDKTGDDVSEDITAAVAAGIPVAVQ